MSEKQAVACFLSAAFVAKKGDLKKFLALIKLSRSGYEVIGERGEIHEI